MKNMDKELTVPKWVLINQLTISQMPQNLSAQIVCLIPKVWDFYEKRFHWASVVRGKELYVKWKMHLGLSFTIHRFFEILHQANSITASNVRHKR